MFLWIIGDGYLSNRKMFLMHYNIPFSNSPLDGAYICSQWKKLRRGKKCVEGKKLRRGETIASREKNCVEGKIASGQKIVSR